MLKNKTVEDYLFQNPQWLTELSILRTLIDETELEETIKWGMPVYTLNNKNVVGLTGFKAHFGLWFYKGGLMPDPDNILANAQDGKTKGMRHIYLTKASEIKKTQIRKYLKAAIATERAGLKIVVVPRKLEVPPIMSQALEEDKALGKAYRAMRKSDQIDFAEYISNAKRVDTKVRRLAKIIEMIMNGEALHDKYRH